MHFTSALTSLLLASSAAALPPTRVGTVVNSTTGHLETRSLNVSEPVILPRNGNYSHPILPRNGNYSHGSLFAGSRPNLHVPRWNINSTEEVAKAVFPRLSLDKNSTEGIFEKRDLEGVALPSGVIGKRNPSPTGYVKRSYGTGTPFQA